MAEFQKSAYTAKTHRTVLCGFFDGIFRSFFLKLSRNRPVQMGLPGIPVRIMYTTDFWLQKGLIYDIVRLVYHALINISQNIQNTLRRKYI